MECNHNLHNSCIDNSMIMGGGGVGGGLTLGYSNVSFR